MSAPVPRADRLPQILARLRLASGLVLFAYVAVHLANHVLGIHSVAAMESAAMAIVGVLHLPPVTALLYAALLVHFLLALWALYRRKRLWPMPAGEAAQLLLGLAIIPLLAGHVIGTRVAGILFGLFYSHTYVLTGLGVLMPEIGLRHGVALLVAWTHGCLGIWLWLRLAPVWPRIQPLMFAGALLLPALALAGFYVGIREVAIRAQQPGWVETTLRELKAPGPAAQAELGRLNDLVLAIWGGGIALALAGRRVRALAERRRSRVRISYPGNRVVEVPTGTSVLEASQSAGIAHASVCGGRGRCSTCRVRLGGGTPEQPPPTPEEQAVLARIKATPNMRLACQLRPVTDLAVTPLLPPSASTRDARLRPGGRAPLGQEHDVAVLFADLRGFTQIAEQKLPYDVVFVLNRYFDAMGRAIESAGGQVDKFIGDGVMALFGTGGDTAAGARQALAAARQMSLNLAELNAALAHDLEAPLRLGIGIHVGPAIVGEMGYGRAVGLTAIGDTVNIASRIEALAKRFQAELVISDSAAEAAGFERAGWRQERTEIRGRRALIEVVVVPKAADLAIP
jgi:adenylate cyclase